LKTQDFPQSERRTPSNMAWQAFGRQVQDRKRAIANGRILNFL
jgi:hypothetical protein